MEDEWEEEYVIVELEGLMDMAHFDQENLTNSILGLNTETPMLQTGDLLFTGRYEEPLGTCILLEDTSPPGNNPDPSGPSVKEKDKPKTLEYSCLVTKKLCMQRAFLTEKSQTNPDENSMSSTDSQKQEEAACSQDVAMEKSSGQ